MFPLLLFSLTEFYLSKCLLFFVAMSASKKGRKQNVSTDDEGFESYHNMYLLTEWEGRAGKYLARPNSVNKYIISLLTMVICT